MTNYDRIKQMTIDEMAIEISCAGECNYCIAQNRCDRLPSDVVATIPCRELVKQWLESEAEE